MRNPCYTCERALLDKNECALGCERRHEYCVHLGISVTGETPKSCSWEDLEPPKHHNRPKPPRPPKVLKPPKLPKPPKVPKPPYDWHAPRGMRSKGGRLEKATALIKEGKSNREICRLTGMSTNTVAKLRKILEAENGGPFLCVCGKLVTHKGWCPYRFAKSPKRQLLLNHKPFR